MKELDPPAPADVNGGLAPRRLEELPYVDPVPIGDPRIHVDPIPPPVPQ